MPEVLISVHLDPEARRALRGSSALLDATTHTTVNAAIVDHAALLRLAVLPGSASMDLFRDGRKFTVTVSHALAAT